MNSPEVKKHLAKRHNAERRFKAFGLLAIISALAFLVLLFVSVFEKSHTVFGQTEIKLPIHLDAELIEQDNYRALIKKSLYGLFPEVKGRKNKRTLSKLLSSGASFELRDIIMAAPDKFGETIEVWLPASDDVDMMMKGATETTGPNLGPTAVKHVKWIDALTADGRIEQHFNWRFFLNGDSREPELAGILGAVVGSAFTIVTCLVLAFPIGVMSAIYLQEFAPKNRWIDLIEINITNLAAVPSIVFGLLGAAVLLNFLDMPRSAPIVGGVVLALMTLPTIIIASRSGLQSVPPSIREAAFGIGASPQQVVLHHVLPLAMPSVLTGTIIAMIRALGETAPLLMIGMVAFIVDIPSGPTDPAAVLPVQIYLWADAPERAFVERSAAAILVLLSFVIVMNLSVAVLRRRFEKKW